MAEIAGSLLRSPRHLPGARGLARGLSHFCDAPLSEPPGRVPFLESLPAPPACPDVAWRRSAANPAVSRATIRPAILPQRAVLRALGRVATPGTWGLSHGSRWQHRVHLTPRVLELGTIASAQEVSVQLFNAWPFAVRIEAVDGEGEGLTLHPPGPLPWRMAAQQEDAWRLRIAAEGASELSALLHWRVVRADTGQPLPGVLLRVSAQRILPWPFAPHWGGEAPAQILRWKTHILRSPTGAEHRQCLRWWPQCAWEFESLCDAPEHSLLQRMSTVWAHRPFALPLWVHAQQLRQSVAAGQWVLPCATAHVPFAARGLVALCRSGPARIDSVQVLQVAQVLPEGLRLVRPLSQSLPEGIRIMPAVTARLRSMPEVQRITDRLHSARVTLDATDADALSAHLPRHWQALWGATMPEAAPAPAPSPDALPDAPPALPLYRGHAVLLCPPDEGESLRASARQSVQWLDNHIAAALPVGMTGFAQAQRQHRFFLHGRAEQAAFLALLHHLRGSHRALWLPGFSADLALATPPEGAATSARLLYVAACAYDSFGLGRENLQDICIERPGLPPILRRVQQLHAAPGVHRLRLDAPLPEDFSPEQVGRISFMALARMVSDEVRIDYVGDAAGVATCTLEFSSLRSQAEEVPASAAAPAPDGS